MFAVCGLVMLNEQVHIQVFVLRNIWPGESLFTLFTVLSASVYLSFNSVIENCKRVWLVGRLVVALFSSTWRTCFNNWRHRLGSVGTFCKSATESEKLAFSGLLLDLMSTHLFNLGDDQINQFCSTSLLGTLASYFDRKYGFWSLQMKGKITSPNCKTLAVTRLKSF